MGRDERRQVRVDVLAELAGNFSKSRVSAKAWRHDIGGPSFQPVTIKVDAR
ncbi:hypothetical protein [Sorangium sp. So ce1078]|uniref:hypothetical protein n=1 Tax=Sorangium sp. So ce1078 TaxID=3133329 RepID=UPI003F60D760